MPAGISAAETNRRIEQLTEKITMYHREILTEQGYITAELVKNAVTGAGRRRECLLEPFREHNGEYAAQSGVTRAERSTTKPAFRLKLALRGGRAWPLALHPSRSLE
ncbi:MAG: hypothetical protein LBU98_04805 [Alistipes sp.]|nr:hypothetical protein [Alistipes sp.]